MTGISLYDLLSEYKIFSHLRILCTDINCDGMLGGPNVDLYRNCVDRFPHFRFQASGGVGKLSDFRDLRDAGVSSVIVGKALCEKKFTLSDALSEVARC